MACVCRVFSTEQCIFPKSASRRSGKYRRLQKTDLFVRFAQSTSGSHIDDIQRSTRKVGRSKTLEDCKEGSESDTKSLKAKIKLLEERLLRLEAEMSQITDQVRDISLLKTFHSSSQDEEIEKQQHVGMVAKIEAELSDDMDEVLAGFTEVMSRGYMDAVHRLRERLMVTEWELSVKQVAMRRGVALFEKLCAERRIEGIDFEDISALYEDPTNVDIIKDPHLRLRARACINECMTEEQLRVYRICTEKAEELAKDFVHGELIARVLPEDGMLRALKSVAGPAMRAIMQRN